MLSSFSFDYILQSLFVETETYENDEYKEKSNYTNKALSIAERSHIVRTTHMDK